MIEDLFRVCEAAETMDATNREESAPPKGVTTATKGEARDLLSLETLSSAPAHRKCGADNIAALIPKIVAPPVAEFEKLIHDLEEAKKYLQSEGDTNSEGDGSLSPIDLRRPRSRCGLSRRLSASGGNQAIPCNNRQPHPWHAFPAQALLDLAVHLPGGQPQPHRSPANIHEDRSFAVIE